MPPDDDLHRRLLATFRVEAGEHLATIAAALDGIERGGGDTGERADALLRTVHTLKGAARSVDLADVEGLCQLSEVLLREVKHRRAPADAGLVQSLHEAFDAVAALIGEGLPRHRLAEVSARLRRGAAKPREVLVSDPPAVDSDAAPPIAPVLGGADNGRSGTVIEMVRPAADDERISTVRVEVDRLARLTLLSEALLVPKLAAAERAAAARGVADDLARLRAGLRPVGQRRASPDPAAVDDTLRSAEARARQLTTMLRNDHKNLRSAVDDLLEEMRRVRIMPAATMLEAFPRMVRDLARETRKEVAWSAIGADVEIDRRVIDLVKDPLLHLVRNAVDHGIEPPDEREARGKPRRGKVSVFVRRQRGRVTIEVSDDGRGLDLSALRSAAVRARAFSPDQASDIADTAALDLAFRAGVSTSPVVTSISGNGLGLAIVREAVERVDGKVSVVSSSEAGTVIRLVVPATITTYGGLLAVAGGVRLLWPTESLVRVIGIPAAEVQPSLARGSLIVAGEALPVARLATVLGLPARKDADERRRIPALVGVGGGRRGVLLVDEVVGSREIVVKDFRPPLRRLRHIMTAGLLGTGELVLVARPSGVLFSMNAAAPIDPPAKTVAARQFSVLVVDDSITTRTMERNLLEAAGYQVRTAADGQDALNILANEGGVDLVLSDVDMPRIDGFELTEAIRANPKLTHLPIVLVTALETREDKERGVRVGANAYVLKSAFDQANLLEIVRRLI